MPGTSSVENYIGGDLEPDITRVIHDQPLPQIVMIT